MTQLQDRMIQDMRLHDLAEATQRTYIDAVRNLEKYFGRPPDQLSEDEIRQFFVQLTERQGRSRSTVRVHLFAIKFLFRYTLRRPLHVLYLIRVRRDRKLPAVLSREEARLLLRGIINPVARMSAVLMYTCGLRVSESIHLLEEGVDIRSIQGMLGHRSIRSTIPYLHLTQRSMKNIHCSVNELMGDL